MNTPTEDVDASDQWNKIENAETNQSRSRARLDVWRRAIALALNTRPVEHSVVTTTVSDQVHYCVLLFKLFAVLIKNSLSAAKIQNA